MIGTSSSSSSSSSSIEHVAKAFWRTANSLPLHVLPPSMLPGSRHGRVVRLVSAACVLFMTAIVCALVFTCVWWVLFASSASSSSLVPNTPSVVWSSTTNGIRQTLVEAGNRSELQKVSHGPRVDEVNEKSALKRLEQALERDRKRGQQKQHEQLVVAPPHVTEAQSTTPVIVFTFNRAENLRTTLDSIFSVRPDTGFPIYVSQDGGHAEVAKVIESYGDRVRHLKFTWTGRPDARYKTAYLKIAAHYGWALGEVFDRNEDKSVQNVILMEDDMRVAPDFFSYFTHAGRLLAEDSSLLCVSAWNDNGRKPLVADPYALYRTDCFPGLGWMMARHLWDELKDKWPSGFWDDWLREPPQRKGRSCIFPEVNRVYTFGKVGSSDGQFFDEFLANIQLNEVEIDWSTRDLSYLKKPAYDTWLDKMIEEAIVAETVADAKQMIEDELQSGVPIELLKDHKVYYVHNLQTLTSIIQPLGLITDHKAGVPRTSYKDIMFFRYRQARIFIVPKDPQ